MNQPPTKKEQATFSAGIIPVFPCIKSGGLDESSPYINKKLH